MVAVGYKTIEEMHARNVEYAHHRMQIPMTDEQYLFWDNILTNHYDEAITLYQDLLAQTYYQRRNRCYDPGALRGELTLKIEATKEYMRIGSLTWLGRAFRS